MATKSSYESSNTKVHRTRTLSNCPFYKDRTFGIIRNNFNVTLNVTFSSFEKLKSPAEP